MLHRLSLHIDTTIKEGKKLASLFIGATEPWIRRSEFYDIHNQDSITANNLNVRAG
jgi:hypothetical protein